MVCGLVRRGSEKLIRRQWVARAFDWLCRASNRSGQLSKGGERVFQLFLRVRANNYIKAGVGRNAGTAACAFRAIEDSLGRAKAEQAGLESRIEDVARAALTLGNDSDEYLTRDLKSVRYQSSLSTEIANGQLRLNELRVTIRRIHERLDLERRRARLEASELGSAPQPAHQRREGLSFWQTVKTTMFK
jgi:hypothetical protein